jgi:hypothetical protein
MHKQFGNKWSDNVRDHLCGIALYINIFSESIHHFIHPSFFFTKSYTTPAKGIYEWNYVLGDQGPIKMRLNSFFCAEKSVFLLFMEFNE